MKIINNFKIIGISVHTTNKANQSAQDLGKLWEQFFINNILDKVSNKLNNSIYAVYTDYKSDYTEEYTAIIGVDMQIKFPVVVKLHFCKFCFDY